MSKSRSPQEVDLRLREIAVEIKGGRPASLYENEIDQLLGTGIPAPDEAKNEAWERSHRRR